MTDDVDFVLGKCGKVCRFFKSAPKDNTFFSNVSVESTLFFVSSAFFRKKVCFKGIKEPLTIPKSLFWPIIGMVSGDNGSEKLGRVTD